MYKRTALVIGMAALAGIGLTKTTRAFDPDQVEQLKTTHKCVQCDLSDAQLNAFDLDNADLSGANLYRAQLYGAHLRGANLAGAILDEANLKLANLSGATDAALAGAVTDERTVCPDGSNGPCR
ncbi:MAG TPA: pentapeptide repeat-containing protein [Vicinamibacterales bacterium]|nr:pentapeptide repeat-containing protein [Vicinamibacterales bacterium]